MNDTNSHLEDILLFFKMNITCKARHTETNAGVNGSKAHCKQAASMHSQDLPNEKIQDLWGLCNWIQCCTDLLVTLGLCFCTATARNGSLAVVLHVMRTEPSIRFVGDKQYLHSLDSKVTLVLRDVA